MKKVRFVRLIGAFLLFSGGFAAVNAQTGLSRGDDAFDHSVTSGIEDSQSSISLEMIVDEIDESGYDVDVADGFDEEWEEELWIEEELGDLDADYISDESSDGFESIEDVLLPEEILDGWSDNNWENPEDLIETAEISDSEDIEEFDFEGIALEEDMEEVDDEMVSLENEFMLEDDDWELTSMLDEYAEEEEEGEWWEEDNEIEEMLFDWELDEMEELDFDEDLDLLEEIFNG